MWFVQSMSFFFFIFVKPSLALPITRAECLQRHSSSNIHVFLTVSSVTLSSTWDNVVKRQLEINWLGNSIKEGDSVGIYTADPLVHPSAKPAFAVDPSHHPDGYVRTNVEMPFIFFNLTSLDQLPCLGFWGAYRSRNGKVLASSCLRTRPFWMEENARYLSSQALHEIMIPGSHDSGSYDNHKFWNPLRKYQYTQEEPIFNQLMYGLRYFDLRIGYYPSDKNKYYINHSIMSSDNSVASVLDQVLEFINATKEIVILDFHNFPVGFDDHLQVHYNLMDMIIEKFGHLLIPHTQVYKKATYGYLWNNNKRILVCYNQDDLRKLRHPHFWPGVIRAWGNEQDPRYLKEYFTSFFHRPLPNSLWAAMAELTPNGPSMLTHPIGGLRLFADEINRNITHWFRDVFWQKANIVATDFFLGNNIIEVAIETNRIKMRCPRTKH